MIHITIASLHNRLVSKRNQSVFYCLNSEERMWFYGEKEDI